MVPGCICYEGLVKEAAALQAFPGRDAEEAEQQEWWLRARGAISGLTGFGSYGAKNFVNFLSATFGSFPGGKLDPEPLVGPNPNFVARMLEVAETKEASKLRMKFSLPLFVFLFCGGFVWGRTRRASDP